MTKIWWSRAVLLMGLWMMSLPLGAATITVNDPGDDPNTKKCTLRKAVQSANADSTSFAPGCTAGNGFDEIVFDPKEVPAGTLIGIENPNDPINLSSPLWIKGPEPQEEWVKIGGMVQSRIFRIGTGVEVILENLTLLGGFESGEGAALLVDTSAASVVIVNCRFEGNTAQGGGGAIANKGSAITIKRSVFAFNKSGAFGGALSGGGNWKIEDTEFSSNKSDFGGGAVICTNSDSTLDITRSSFQDNSTAGTASLPPGSPSMGGGAVSSGCKTKILHSLFELNHDFGLTGGGALLVGAGGKTTVVESIFKRNTAGLFPGDVTLAGAAQRGGGAIFSRGSLILDQSVVERNIAKGSLGGGGIVFHAASTDENVIVNSMIYRNISTLHEQVAPDKSPAQPGEGAGVTVNGFSHVDIIGSSLVGNMGKNELFVVDNEAGDVILKNTLIDGWFTQETCGGDLLNIFDGDNGIGGSNLQSDSELQGLALPTCQGIPTGKIDSKEQSGDFLVPIPAGSLKFTYTQPSQNGPTAKAGDPVTCQGFPMMGRDLLDEVRAEKCTIGAVEAP